MSQWPTCELREMRAVLEVVNVVPERCLVIDVHVIEANKRKCKQRVTCTPQGKHG